MDTDTEMVEFLKREKVDVVVACDVAKSQLVACLFPCLLQEDTNQV